MRRSLKHLRLVVMLAGLWFVASPQQAQSYCGNPYYGCSEFMLDAYAYCASLQGYLCGGFCVQDECCNCSSEWDCMTGGFGCAYEPTIWASVECCIEEG